MDIRYLQKSDEVEVVNDYGYPTYYRMDELEQVDANERALGTETEYRTPDGIHIIFYPEGHLSDYYWENENERNGKCTNA